MVIVSMELGFLLSTKVASLNGIGQLFLSKISLLFIYLFIYRDFGDLFQLCIEAERNKETRTAFHSKKTHWTRLQHAVFILSCMLTVSSILLHSAWMSSHFCTFPG